MLQQTTPKQVSLDAKGILGEALMPTRDANSKPIMTGMGAIRGELPNEFRRCRAVTIG